MGDRHSEERYFERGGDYSTYLDMAPHAVSLIRTLGNRVAATNKAFQAISGYSEEELLDCELSELGFWKAPDEWGSILELAKSSGEVLDAPIELKCKNCRPVSVLLSVRFIDIRGESFYLVVFNDAVSERNVQQFMQQISNNYRAMFNNKGVGIAHCRTIFDAEGKPVNFIYVDVNSAFETYTGLSKENVIGKTVTEVIPGISQEEVDKRIQVAITGNEIQVESYVAHLNRWYNVHIYSPEKGDFVSLFIDISEQKFAELELKKHSEVLERNYAKLAREIVERRRTEAALGESERRLREIIQNFPGLVFQLQIRPDGSNNMTFLSPGAKLFFGIDALHDLHDFDINTRIHHDDRKRVLGSLDEAIRESKEWVFEARITVPSKELKWVQGIATPSSEGNEFVFNGIILDITDRKCTEQALKNSEKLYRSLFSTMTEAFMHCEMIFNAKGQPHDYRILESNDAFQSHTGFKWDHSGGKTLKEVFPDLEESWVSNYGSVVLSGLPVHFEEFHHGTNRTYDVYAYKTGKNTFAAIFTDVTVRKEEEHSLKFSLEKLKLLFEFVPYGFTICDEQGKIIEANKEAERLLGVARELHTNRWIDSKEWKIIRVDGTVMPPEEFASVRALKENCIVRDVKMGIVKDNGEVTWINVSAAPMQMKGYGVAITYTEIPV